MKRLNKNNTIATTAMMTKTNTMKNKMNFFAKVVMLVGMLGMVLPNVAWGQQPWTKGSDGKWYIINVTDQQIAHTTVNIPGIGPISSEHDDKTYTVYVPNVACRGTFKAKSVTSASKTFDAQLLDNNSSIITVTAPKNSTYTQTNYQFNDLYTHGGTTTLTAKVSDDNGNQRDKQCQVIIPVPAHINVNGELDFGSVEIGASKTLQIEFTSFMNYSSNSSKGDGKLKMKLINTSQTGAIFPYDDSKYSDFTGNGLVLCENNQAYSPYNTSVSWTNDNVLSIQVRPNSMPTDGKITATIQVFFKDGSGDTISEDISVTVNVSPKTPIFDWKSSDIVRGTTKNFNDIVALKDLNAGGYFTFEETDEDGSVLDASTKKLSIDNVNEQVTALMSASIGQTHITATYHPETGSVYKEYSETSTIDVSLNQLADRTITWNADFTGFLDNHSGTIDLTSDDWKATTIGNGTITYSVADPTIATVNGTTLTINNVIGTTTITASIPADNQYKRAEASKPLIVSNHNGCTSYLINSSQTYNSEATFSFDGQPSEVKWTIQGNNYSSGSTVYLKTLTGSVIDQKTVTSSAQVFTTTLGSEYQSERGFIVSGLRAATLNDWGYVNLTSFQVLMATFFNEPSNKDIVYGDVIIAHPASTPVIIGSFSNTPGNITLQIERYSTDDNTWNAFSFEDGSKTKTISTGCGKKGNVSTNVIFSPSAEGSNNAKIKVSIYDGTETKEFHINLSGTGTKYNPTLAKVNSLPSGMDALYTEENGNISLTGFATVDNTVQEVKYKSSDDDVAEVINGTLQIKKAGQFTLTAYVEETTAYNYKEKDLETYTVSLAKPHITPSISCGTDNAFVFGEYKLTATSDDIGNTQKHSDGTISFVRPNDNIAELVTKTDGTYIHFLDRGTDDGTDVTITVNITASSDGVFDEGSTTLTVKAKKVDIAWVGSWTETMPDDLYYNGGSLTLGNYNYTHKNELANVPTVPAPTYSIVSGSDVINLNNGVVTAKKIGTATVSVQLAATKNSNALTTTTTTTITTSKNPNLAIDWNGTDLTENRSVGDDLTLLAKTNVTDRSVSYTFDQDPAGIISQTENTITFDHVGTVAITASTQDNDEVYDKATDTKTITIGKATSTLTWTQDLSGLTTTTGSFNVSGLSCKYGAKNVDVKNEVKFKNYDSNLLTYNNDGTFTVASAIDADTKTTSITAYYEGNDDVEKSNEVTIQVTISRTTNIVTWTPASIPDDTYYVFSQVMLNGTTFSADGLGTGAVTYEAVQNCTKINDNTFKITNIGEGVTIRATEATDGQYKSASGEITFIPKKVTPELNWNQSDFGDKKVGDTDFGFTSATWTNTQGEPDANKWADDEVTIKYTASNDAITVNNGNTISINKAGVVTLEASIKEEKNHFASNAISKTINIAFADDFTVECIGYANESTDTEIDMNEDMVKQGTLSLTSSTNSHFTATFDGYKMTITFTPAEYGTGEENAIFTITDNGNNKTYTINVHGTCLKHEQTINWIDDKTIRKGSQKLGTELLSSWSPQEKQPLFSSDNTNVIGIYDENGMPVTEGVYIEAIESGTAHITARLAGDDSYAEATETAEFSVNGKRSTQIVWSQSLMFLHVSDGTVPLTAEVRSGSISTGQTITYTLTCTDNSVRLSDDGQSIVIAHDGQATITASAAETTNYEAPSPETKTIIVKPDGANTCNDAINTTTEVKQSDSPKNIYFNETKSDKTKYYKADKVTFDYELTAGTLTSTTTKHIKVFNIYSDNTTRIIHDYSCDKRPLSGKGCSEKENELSIDENAIGLRFEVDNTNFRDNRAYNITITKASYIRNTSTTAQPFGNVNIGQSSTIQIQAAEYYNLKDPVSVELVNLGDYTNPGEFSIVDEDGDNRGNGCDDSGNIIVSVRFSPTSGLKTPQNTSKSCQLKITGTKKNGSTETVYVDLTGIAVRNPQQMQEWTQQLNLNALSTKNGPVILHASTNIEEEGITKEANSYIITSQKDLNGNTATNVASIDNVNKLDIFRSGIITITASHTGDDKYMPTTNNQTKEITISLADPGFDYDETTLPENGIIYYGDNSVALQAIPTVKDLDKKVSTGTISYTYEAINNVNGIATVGQSNGTITPIKAGTFKVKAHITEEIKHVFAPDNKYTTIEIKPATQSISWDAGQVNSINTVGSNTEVKLSATSKNESVSGDLPGGAVRFEIKSGDDYAKIEQRGNDYYLVSKSNGNGYVVVRAIADGDDEHYVSLDDESNNKEFTVNKVSAEESFTFTGITMTYNDAPVNLNDKIANTLELTLGTDFNVTYIETEFTDYITISQNLITPVNANVDEDGNLVVMPITVSISGMTNYNDFTGTINVTVAKAEPSLEWSTEPSDIYYGDELEFGAQTNSDGGGQITYSATPSGVIDISDATQSECTVLKAGTVTIRAQIGEGTNYIGGKYIEKQITVNPRPATLTFDDIEITYDLTTQYNLLEHLHNNDDLDLTNCTISYSLSDGIDAQYIWFNGNNVGTHKVKNNEENIEVIAKFTLANYSIAPCTFNIKVMRAIPIITWTTDGDETVQFGTSDKYITATTTTPTTEQGNGIDYDIIIPSGSNGNATIGTDGLINTLHVGVVTVRAKSKQTQNYAEVEIEKTVTITRNKQEITWIAGGEVSIKAINLNTPVSIAAPELRYQSNIATTFIYSNSGVIITTDAAGNFAIKLLDNSFTETVITANNAGDDNLDAADPVVLKVFIEKEPQVINWANSMIDNSNTGKEFTIYTTNSTTVPVNIGADAGKARTVKSGGSIIDPIVQFRVESVYDEDGNDISNICTASENPTPDKLVTIDETTQEIKYTGAGSGTIKIVAYRDGDNAYSSTDYLGTNKWIILHIEKIEPNSVTLDNLSNVHYGDKVTLNASVDPAGLNPDIKYRYSSEFEGLSFDNDNNIVDVTGVGTGAIITATNVEDCWYSENSGSCASFDIAQTPQEIVWEQTINAQPVVGATDIQLTAYAIDSRHNDQSTTCLELTDDGKYITAKTAGDNTITASETDMTVTYNVEELTGEDGFRKIADETGTIVTVDDASGLLHVTGIGVGRVKITPTASNGVHYTSISGTPIYVTVQKIDIELSGIPTDDVLSFENLTSTTDDFDLKSVLIDDYGMTTNYPEGKYSYSFTSLNTDIATIDEENGVLKAYKMTGDETPLQIVITATETVTGSSDSETIKVVITRGTLIFNIAAESGDNKWTNPANWSREDIVTGHTDINNKISDLSEYNVLINGSCFIGKDEAEDADETAFLSHTINALCNDLTINQNEENNAKLVIGEASTLNVAGNLMNTDASKLVLTANYWGQASVVFNSGTPKATIEMYIPEGNGSKTDPKWQYRGICVSDFSPITVVPVVNEDGTSGGTINPWSYVYVYEWDESQNADLTHGCWVNGRSGSDIATRPLEPWKGYCFANMTQAPSSELWLTYTGTLINSATHEYNLTKTPSGRDTEYANYGVNLLTNSYAAPMTIGDIVFGDNDNNNDNDEAYATVTFYNAGTHADWAAHHAETIENQYGEYPGQMTVCPQNTSNETQGVVSIPAGQSFFVTAKNSGNIVKFNYSDIIADLGPSRRMFLPGERESEYNVLGIRVKGKENGDRLVLLECETCTRQYDNGYDGYKMLGKEGLPQIYAYNKFGNTAVNADSTLNKQYVGFMAGSDDETYTISFETDKLFGYHSLYLTDRKLNETVDILAGETYQFKGYTVGENMRFQINGITEQEWNNENDDDDDNDDSNVCDLRVVGNTLYVQGFTTDHYPAARVELFDMTGNIVWSTPLTSERLYDLPQLPQGIYTVRLGDCHVKYVTK